MSCVVATPSGFISVPLHRELWGEGLFVCFIFSFFFFPYLSVF